MKAHGQHTRSFVALGFVIAVLTNLTHAAGAQSLIETPSLTAGVRAGTMPPVNERIPQKPQVVDLAAVGYELGRHGGRLRLLMGGQRDLRMMTVYSYARLVGYDQNMSLSASILESYQVEDGRIFTFRLRDGHKWSDGHPFTTEDFRYVFEDVIGNKKLSPLGPPPAMLVDGQPPKFEVIDRLTVRYTWNKHNPTFLAKLAAPRPLEIYAPAHYLKRFHKGYTDAGKLAELVAAARVRSWSSLHRRMARQYRNENPDLPTP